MGILHNESLIVPSSHYLMGVSWRTPDGSSVKLVPTEAPEFWGYSWEQFDGQQENQTADLFHLQPNGVKIPLPPWMFNVKLDQAATFPAAGRYLLKANFQLLEHKGSPVEYNLFAGTLSSGWRTLEGGEGLWVFRAARAGAAKVGIQLRNTYADATGRIELYTLSLEPVAANFGDANVPEIFPDAVTTPAPAPIPTPTSASPPPVVTVPRASGLLAPYQPQTLEEFKAAVEFLLALGLL